MSAPSYVSPMYLETVHTLCICRFSDWVSGLVPEDLEENLVIGAFLSCHFGSIEVPYFNFLHYHCHEMILMNLSSLFFLANYGIRMNPTAITTALLPRLVRKMWITHELRSHLTPHIPALASGSIDLLMNSRLFDRVEKVHQRVNETSRPSYVWLPIRIRIAL